MAELVDDVERCKEILIDALRYNASQMLLGRLLHHLDDVAAGKLGFNESLRRIRIALRLFVDEELAETLTARLRRIVNPAYPSMQASAK